MQIVGDLPARCILAICQAAWNNAAFASELGKCLVAAKRTEHDHLLEEFLQGIL